MRQVSKTVRMSTGLDRLFQEARALQPATATVSSNLTYIMALEHGHSQQAPHGMVRVHGREYQRMLGEALRHHFDPTPGRTQRSLDRGVTDAALEIMAAIVERTPVDTGRAKGAWVVTLPGGRRVESGPTITAEQQAAIHKARRKR